MNENARIIYYDLPCSVKGFVKRTSDDYYVIVLNSRLNWEQNQSSLKHELEHIQNGDLYTPQDVQELEFLRHNL